MVRNEIYRNSESKFMDLTLAQTIGDAGVLLPLSIIGQGTESDQRVGNRIKINGIKMRTLVSAADDINYLRFGIIKADQNITVASMPDINALYKSKEYGFKVLWSKTVCVQGNAAAQSVSAPPQQLFTAWKKCFGHSYYEDSTTAQPVRGLYWLFVTSDSASTPDPRFATDVRIYFKDV